MTRSVTLSGITWNHTRGFVPMVATAQRYMDEHPHVTINWSKRSLKDFGDFPIERLAERFDLLIIDHPFAGYAADASRAGSAGRASAGGYLADQEANSVGPSYRELCRRRSPLGAGGRCRHAGQRLPPRPARTPRCRRSPETWDDLLALARRGLVAVAAAPVDTLMHLYMLCLGLGEEPFQSDDEIVVPRGRRSLRWSCCASWSSRASRRISSATRSAPGRRFPRDDRSPTARSPTATRTTAGADYTENRLAFGGLVSLNGKRLRSTLGGTGLAISTRCQEIETAVDYAAYVASPACQRGLYTLSGGQPGHRAAWLDPANDQLCNGFFGDTLQTLDEAYLRPRYAGYIPFQDHAGDLVRDFLRDGGDARAIRSSRQRALSEEPRHA